MAGQPQQQEFSVQELYAATGGFNKLCVIGEGGFGKVYRAMINLTPVAVKVLVLVCVRTWRGVWGANHSPPAGRRQTAGATSSQAITILARMPTMLQVLDQEGLQGMTEFQNEVCCWEVAAWGVA